MVDLVIMLFSYLGVISICVGMSVIADQAPATVQHQPRPVATSRDKSWGRQDRDNSGRDENGEKDDRGTENFGRNVKFSANVKRFSDGRIGDRLGRLHGRWVSAAIGLSASKSFLTLKGSSSSVIRDSKKEKKTDVIPPAGVNSTIHKFQCGAIFVEAPSICTILINIEYCYRTFNPSSQLDKTPPNHRRFSIYARQPTNSSLDKSQLNTSLPRLSTLNSF